MLLVLLGGISGYMLVCVLMVMCSSVGFGWVSSVVRLFLMLLWVLMCVVGMLNICVRVVKLGLLDRLILLYCLVKNSFCYW